MPSRSLRPAILGLVAALVLLGPGPAGAQAPPPPGSQLSSRDSLVALARLLSVVRFFHPSDEGAACDWNRFAVAAVAQVEGAATPQELAARLRALFAPVAPTLRIARAAGDGGGASPAAALLPPKGGGAGLRTVAWRHYGVLLDQKKAVFGSERIDDRSDLGWGNLAQAVPAGALRGRKVRLSAAIDAEVAGRGKAQLWLRVDRAGGQRGFFDNMADRPVREPGWRTVEIAGTVDPDAESIAIGLAFTGAGRVRIDDVKLESADDGPPVQARLRNADFRTGEAKRQPPGWTFPYESVRAGYRLGLLVGPPCRDGGCAEIEAGPIADPPFAKPADTLTLDLGAGLRALVPITLYADERGTLPHAATRTSCVQGDAKSAGDARSERLAALLLAWGTIDLFRAYREEDGAPPGWSESLRAALPDALAAVDDRTFLSAFRRLLAGLADGNARVSHNGLGPTHRLPIEWRFLDGNHLYVTEVAPGLTDPHRGELVAAVDGEPVSGHHLLQGGETAGATPEARRAAASQSFLFGDENSPVILDIRAGRDNVRRVELQRNLPANRPVAPPKPGPIAELRPGVLYVDLGRLDDGAFEAALPRLAAAQGLVFDLRDGTDVSNKLISHLMPGTVLGPRLLLPVRLRPDGPPLSYLETFWTLFPLEPSLAARCAFLIDETDSGYSETLLAIVAHERRCELVGGTTGGSNGSINVMNLPGGFTLTFTGLKVLNPDGSRHYGIGIPPTIPVQPTPMEIAAGWDAVLEKGLDAVVDE